VSRLFSFVSFERLLTGSSFLFQHSKSNRGTQTQVRNFIVRLANALMLFGSPTHRLESQLESTARVLEVSFSSSSSSASAPFSFPSSNLFNNRSLSSLLNLSLTLISSSKRFWSRPPSLLDADPSSTHLPLLSQPSFPSHPLL